MKLKITMDNGDEYWTNWIGWAGTNDKTSDDIEGWLSEDLEKIIILLLTLWVQIQMNQ